MHAPHHGKMHEPKLIILPCTGKIIGFTVCIKYMNSDGTGYGIYLESWCSRHSDAISIRKQAQEGELKARQCRYPKMLRKGNSLRKSIAGGGCRITWKN